MKYSVYDNFTDVHTINKLTFVDCLMLSAAMDFLFVFPLRYYGVLQ